MNIGLIDVDGHNFPNYALMKISAWHKDHGDNVEWVDPMFGRYDKVYASKIFTFSKDYDFSNIHCEVVKGGTGYDIKSKLPEEIEDCTAMDYTIYPQYPFSIEFFSRGCIRHCPFCLVHDKEGVIRSVKPTELNHRGKWIEVLDNNFFANPNWREAAEFLKRSFLPVNLMGVDVRLIDEEQASFLNNISLRKNIHIAWDLPQYDLTSKLEEVVSYIKPYKITCYVLIGFNSTISQDLYRLNTLKRLGIRPFVQPYRDYKNEREPSQYELDLARWANKMWLFKSIDFEDYSPRKGFKCNTYLNNAKSWHDIFIADAEECSKQLKDKDRNGKDRQKESIR